MRETGAKERGGKELQSLDFIHSSRFSPSSDISSLAQRVGGKASIKTSSSLPHHVTWKFKALLGAEFRHKKHLGHSPEHFLPTPSGTIFRLQKNKAKIGQACSAQWAPKKEKLKLL